MQTEIFAVKAFTEKNDGFFLKVLAKFNFVTHNIFVNIFVLQI